MFHQHALVPTQAPPPPPRPEPLAPPAPPPEAGFSRKRTYPQLEKAAMTPRAIQPRPPRYSVEGSTPIPVSPGMDSIASRGGEPPRKRGRPSKAETELRKAAAQARGEPYPPPRRSTTTKPRNQSTPSGVMSAGSDRAALSPQAAIHTPEPRKVDIPSEGPVGRAAPWMETCAEQKREEGPVSAETGPTTGEAPRHTVQGRTLPPLQSMQLGREEATPRTIRGEPVPTPVSPLGFPFADRDEPAARGGTHSTPERPPVSVPEMAMSTGACGGTVQGVSGLGEEKA